LSRETLERALEVIRKDVNSDKIKIDNPTQNLESYFLDVVHKARAAAEQTSGATSGSQVAAYLRGDAEGKVNTAKVLDRLSAPQPAPIAVSAAQPVDTVDRSKLEALTQSKEPVPAAPAPAPTAADAPKQADLEKANEKLSSLLGKKP
jgi:ABC-2 type transport system ATP-binding protein